MGVTFHRGCGKMLEKESQIDILLEYLKQAKETNNFSEVLLADTDPACPTTIRLSADINSKRETSCYAETYFIGNQEMRFRCAGDQPRSQRIEAAVTTSRNIDGETQLIVTATVLRTVRDSGGYEFAATLHRIRRHFRNAHRIFAECVARSDVNGWNQWYAPMQQSVDLKRLNLSGLSLAQFDLCAANLQGCDLRNANLSGANLSGANLDGCVLDGVVVEGADFFGAAIPARYESLLKAGGLLERESVTLI